MNHWQMIAIAYLLTFAAVALEVVLLLRRRRAAWEYARASLQEDEAADSVPEAGAGAGAVT
jgi:hypothetical protein